MEVEKQIESYQAVIADLRDKLQKCYQRDLAKTARISDLENFLMRIHSVILHKTQPKIENYFGVSDFPESCDEALRSGAILYDYDFEHGHWIILNYVCATCNAPVVDYAPDNVSSMTMYCCANDPWDHPLIIND